MKKLVLVLGLLAALLMVGSAVWAAEGVMLDSVDFGSAGTESGRDLVGWGRSATDDTGGNYGSIGSGGCRLIWDIGGDGGPTSGRDATVLLHTERGAATGLTLRHLDGLADDSFDIYVEHANGSWVSVGHYDGLQTGSEDWVTTNWDLTAIDFGRGRDFRVKLEATGDPWSGFATWGQICFDWVQLYGNGAPR